MRKPTIFIFGALALTACDKHDPILPGVRDNIFNTTNLSVINQPVPNPGEPITTNESSDCPYTQKPDNTIWDETRKVFSGFATGNSVAGTRHPVCAGKFLYAGLSTGELVKINPKTRQIVWVADIYRPSNMTGGASVLDIVAPIGIYEKYIYAGGLGDAFCKISDATGKTVWCAYLGVEKPFVITNTTAYVLDTTNNLNAIRLTDGAIYWRKPVKKSVAPKYTDGAIIVGNEKFDAATGNL